MAAESKTWSRWFKSAPSQSAISGPYITSTPTLLVEAFEFIPGKEGPGSYLDGPRGHTNREILLAEVSSSSPSESSNSHHSQLSVFSSDVGHGEYSAARTHGPIGLPSNAVQSQSQLRPIAPGLGRDLRLASSQDARLIPDTASGASPRWDRDPFPSIYPVPLPGVPVASTSARTGPRKLRKPPPASSSYAQPETLYIVEPLSDSVISPARAGYRSLPASPLSTMSRGSIYARPTSSITVESAGSSLASTRNSSTYSHDGSFFGRGEQFAIDGSTSSYAPSTMSGSSQIPLMPSSTRTTALGTTRKLTKRRPSMPSIPSSPYTEFGSSPLGAPPVPSIPFEALHSATSSQAYGGYDLPRSASHSETLDRRRFGLEGVHGSSSHTRGADPAFMRPILLPFVLSNPPLRSSRSEAEEVIPSTSKPRLRALSTFSLRRSENKVNVATSMPQSSNGHTGRRKTVSDAGHGQLELLPPLVMTPFAEETNPYQPMHARRAPFTTTVSSPTFPSAPSAQRAMMSASSPTLPLPHTGFMVEPYAQLTINGIPNDVGTLWPPPAAFTNEPEVIVVEEVKTEVALPPVRPRMPHRDSHPSRRRWTLQMAMNDDSISNEVLASELDRLREGAAWYRSSGIEGEEGGGHEDEQAWHMYGGPHTGTTQDEGCFGLKLSLRMDAATNTHSSSPAISPYPTTPASAHWQTARRALLTVRELVRTERNYLSCLQELVSGNTSTPPPALMVRYAEALVRVSETLIVKMESDPTAYGVSVAYVACEDSLDSGLVSWCGVVGGFFTSSGKVKLSKENRGASKAAAKAAARESVAPSENYAYSNSPIKRSTSAWRKSLPVIPTAIVHPLSASALAKRDSGKQKEKDPIGPRTSVRIKDTFRPKFTIGKEKEVDRDVTPEKSSGSSTPTEPEPPTPKRSKPSVRDLAILPTQRVMRYVLLFQDLARQTPETSASRVHLERALDAALKIAEQCDRAQGNAAFLFNSSSQRA